MATETKSFQDYIDNLIAKDEGNAKVILFVRPDGSLTDDMDAVTGHGIRIDHVHAEGHEGSSYQVSNSQTENNDDTIIIAFKTPVTAPRMHMLLRIRASLEANVVFLEAPAITNGSGTDLTPMNRERASSNTSLVRNIEAAPTANRVTLDPTITDDGLTIAEEHFGIRQTAGGVSRSEAEWILKANTIYAIRVTSEAASNDLNVALNWYEETPLV